MMDNRIARGLEGVENFKSLRRLEDNVRDAGFLDDEATKALKKKGEELARKILVDRTGIDISDPTPAEKKIIRAITEYLAIKRRGGSDATRTMTVVRNRGLIGAAENSVTRNRPTQGFTTLQKEKLDSLSFEQIVLDHEDEFSTRAIWYSRKTLGLGNATKAPPAKRDLPAQRRTEALLRWLGTRLGPTGEGRIPAFSNAEGAAAVGIADMTKGGQAYGNIQSRLDFACYQLGLPPIGLTAKKPFDRAWQSEGRSWEYPVQQMELAAREYYWRPGDFEELVNATAALPGQAAALWRNELTNNEMGVKAWAESLKVGPRQSPAEDEFTTDPTAPNASDTDGIAAALLTRLSEIEKEYLDAAPKERERVSKTIERGPIGRAVKKANGFRCQLCEALKADAIGFLKKDGQPYVEAHHVSPVHLKEVGSLAASNIVTLCANHHRQVHYGRVEVEICTMEFRFVIEGREVRIRRLGASPAL